MSNCTQEFSRFIQLANVDPLKHPRVQPVDGAQGGQTAAIIQNPNANFWTVVDQRLTTAGATAAQVQAIWFKEADAGTDERLPRLRTDVERRVRRDHAGDPRQVPERADRATSPRASTPATRRPTLNPEPYSYEQGFSVQVDDRGPDQRLRGAELRPCERSGEAPWLDWGTYNWADGSIPRSDGLTWMCSDFQSDGTHPSARAARRWPRSCSSSCTPIRPPRAWYLAQPVPSPTAPARRRRSDACPRSPGAGRRALLERLRVPVFRRDPECLRSGLLRLLARPSSVRQRDALGRPPADPPAGPTTRWTGSGSFPIPITAPMVGTTRFYQGYLRDPLHPDGTGAGVSDGLRVVFSN